MKEVCPEPVNSNDVLDSWKAIAGYLHRGVRTVMRWELVRGLPVRRVPGGGKPAVYALKSELDNWWKSARPELVEQADEYAARPLPPSIAVLPFANLTAGKENEYFSDGLADGIITELTRIQGLRVTARTSSFVFRNQQRVVREIGRKLGVGALLEGSVQRSGARVRVSAQLVGVADGFHLWSECYDRDLADVFAIQDDISRAIAKALQLRLAPVRPTRSTVSLDAYNWWLKARHYQQRASLEGLLKCRMCLERAIALDARFAQPYVGLADLDRAAAHYGMMHPREALTEGQAALSKAFELDDSLGEAHALSGAYRAWMHFDWGGADADFSQALQLAPGSEQVHRFRATHYLVPTNRLREAEQETELAVQLDPLSPLACIEHGKVLLWQRRFDAAQTEMEAAFELAPDYALAIWYRGAAWYFQGRTEEALTYWQSALQRMGSNPAMVGAIGMCLGFLGRQAEARAVLRELDAAARERYVSPVSRAQVYMGLGELEPTFEWLDRAIEERDVHILILPCKPIWDALRPDPRFKVLMQKMCLV
jgi:TolB-like protein/Flp pilus assembly protein TadD